MDSEGRIWLSIIVGGIGFCSGNPLGILVGIGCVGFIIYEVVRDKGQTTPAASPTRAATSQSTAARSTLTLSYAHGQKLVDGTSFKTLELRTTGIFSNSKNIGLPKFTVRMTDMGDANQQPSPVLCVIDHLQAEESIEFEFNLDLDQTLHAGVGSAQPVTFATFPTDFLIFPHQGNRHIQIALEISDRATGRTIVNDSCVWTANVVNPGYLEHEKEESEAFAEALKLAMCLAASDGKFDEVEIKMIQDCGTKWVNALPADRQESRKELFNQALQDATQELRANRWAELEQSSIANLKKADRKSVLYEAYETCLHIVKADGAVHPEEMAQLQRIARGLGLDQATVKMLSDKHLLHVEIAPVDNSSSADKMLGVTEQMTKDDIRKHLNKLFRQYQGLQAHDKEVTRKKAAEWLEMIAAARVRHLS